LKHTCSNDLQFSMKIQWCCKNFMKARLRQMIMRQHCNVFETILQISCFQYELQQHRCNTRAIRHIFPMWWTEEGWSDKANAFSSLKDATPMTKVVTQMLYLIRTNRCIFCLYSKQWSHSYVTFGLQCPLTPKGPRCVFWQYKFFGQVPVARDFYVFAPNFNRRCGRGISFMPTKFQDIWKYE